MKQSVMSLLDLVKQRPHSESHSWKDWLGEITSEGGSGIDRLLLTRARNERMAGAASGGGIISIGSAYKIVSSKDFRGFGSKSTHEVVVKLYYSKQ